MDVSEKIRNFLVKLQNLPDNKKKNVLWTIVVILAVAMFIFWIKLTIDRFSKM